MKKTFLSIWLSLALSSAYADPYAGKIVDAHNQFGCDIKPEEIVRILENSYVDYTLLSTRNPCGAASLSDHFRSKEVKERLPGRIGLIVATKYNDHWLMKKAYENMPSVGYAEILIQHAPHNTKKLVFSGVDEKINSYEVSKKIKTVVESKSPLFLHIELNDFAHKKEQTLEDLKKLSKDIYPHPILLMHMGQIDIDNARDLLTNYSNIYFVTTRADTISFNRMQNRKMSGQKAQEGWINMFDGHKWKPEWKTLVEQHPKRFIFAIDSVHSNHWNQHHRSVGFWKNALGQLDKNTATFVACENSKQLWRLPIDCFN